MTVTTNEPPLARLVKRVHEDEGVSYREMEARAHRAGRVISHSQMQSYAAGTVRKAPTPEQMRAIAAALDIGYERVRAAVFEQFYGYVPREMAHREQSRIGAAIPPDLTKQEEEELERMVKAWVAARRSDS